MRHSIRYSVKIHKRVIAALLLCAAALTCLFCAAGCEEADTGRGAPVGVYYSFGSDADGERAYSLDKSGEALNPDEARFSAKYDGGASLDYSCVLSADALSRAGDIIDVYGIVGWDGFDKPDDDAEKLHFTFRAVYPDGTELNASGCKKYPKQWQEGHDALCAFFESFLGEEMLAADRSAVAVSGEEMEVGTTETEQALKFDTAADGSTRLTACSMGGDVVIPDEYDGAYVTAIAKRAFAGGAITSVSGGAYITTVGDAVCEDCASLTSFELPAGLTAVPSRAFAGCVSLEGAYLPPTVTSVEPQAYYGCTALGEAVLNEGLLSIGRQAFAGCESLRTLRIPYSVTYIGEGAFEGCSSRFKLEVMPFSYALEYAEANGISYSVANVKG